MTLQFVVTPKAPVPVYRRFPGSFTPVLLKFRNCGPGQITLSDLNLPLASGQALAISYDGQGISAEVKGDYALLELD